MTISWNILRLKKHLKQREIKFSMRSETKILLEGL